MDLQAIVDGFLGGQYSSVVLGNDIVKMAGQEYEIFVRKKTVLCIVDKRNGQMKKIFREPKTAYDMIFGSHAAT